ncbi:MAG: ATP-binding cassette domain-containing protein [Acidiferrobacterales bacterium]|nr:ATP-binding cassette domain-containing protein [Acidiferrobacterales bacterium]
MISVANLTKRFGQTVAVDDLTFSVRRGEVLGFLGPNGAGKSTTMKMIAGFLDPDLGSVHIEGIAMAHDPIEAKKRLGYLPEGIPLYGDMTVQSFLTFIARIRGIGNSQIANRIAEVITDVQIGDVLEQPIHTLSKGYKRRVGIAQALLHDPQALVLDEPTDGLDPNQKDQIAALIGKISRKKAIILSTHILTEVESVCNRVMIINQGKIVADQPPATMVEASQLHNSVQLRLSGCDSQAVRQLLLGIDEVADVLYNKNNDSFRLISKTGRSLVDQVWQVAESNGWDVRTLSEQKGKLEDVFRQLTGKR